MVGCDQQARLFEPEAEPGLAVFSREDRSEGTSTAVAKDRKRMSRLVLETPGKVDPERLCYDILKHVDGIKVFPKLAVYNRRQLKVMEHTSRVRDAMKNN